MSNEKLKRVVTRRFKRCNVKAIYAPSCSGNKIGFAILMGRHARNWWDEEWLEGRLVCSIGVQDFSDAIANKDHLVCDPVTQWRCIYCDPEHIELPDDRPVNAKKQFANAELYAERAYNTCSLHHMHHAFAYYLLGKYYQQSQAVYTPLKTALKLMQESESSLVTQIENLTALIDSKNPPTSADQALLKKKLLELVATPHTALCA